MHLTIHRGTKEIGGSCVELTTRNAKILIDFGMPLVDEAGNEFNSKIYKEKSREELTKLKLLPDVKGLYKDEAPQYDAILISHAHPDHFGLLNFIHHQIPVYMSEGTKILIEISEFFNQATCDIQNIKLIKPASEFNIGDIKILPYQVDHAAFDALAFLIEADSKRVFYTGDFRGHGRKSSLYDNLIKNPPANIDYLIMEGTQIGRENVKPKTEEDVEAELINLFKNQQEIIFLACSSQNIDRIVSVYKACMKSGKIFVIDPYTVMVLDKLGQVSKNIPQYNWGKNLKVYFINNSYTKKMADSEALLKYKQAKITEKEILINRQNIILKDNYRLHEKFIKKINPENSLLIYSLWEGYYKGSFKEFWEAHKVPVIKVHTSGHASVNDLKKLVDAFNPDCIIPIHTFNADKYQEVFNKTVLCLKDSETTLL